MTNLQFMTVTAHARMCLGHAVTTTEHMDMLEEHGMA
jgi:hypothetical protein